jgi:sugar lactone lactonase YvrE
LGATLTCELPAVDTHDLTRDDLATLYVTTAARGQPDEPLAGHVFAFRPGVTGLPATPFAG